ncbi:MAG: hypothetical protein QF917_03100 [Candidatus Woesearchaeota archaeon]|nr:hypothetical protein [Candidatus Woesearchaeota archaeon]
MVTSILYPIFNVNTDYVKGAFNSKNPTVAVATQPNQNNDLDKIVESSNIYFGGSRGPNYSPKHIGNKLGVPDNSEFKKWCIETFDNGKYIYEGYKDIAFNIKYTLEQAKTDFWQTPFETTKSKRGDCEDAVFLFYSHLLPKQDNAEIVWGWLIDRRTRIAKAHVWYQLKDKEGRLYAVEGFSNDWNRIIPMEIIKQTESRKPIFILSHLEASGLADMVSKPDSWENYQMLADLYSGSTNFFAPESEDKNSTAGKYTKRHSNPKLDGYITTLPSYNESWEHSAKDRMAVVLSKEISKIFKKLHILFTRYEGQKEDYTKNLQAAYK